MASDRPKRKAIPLRVKLASAMILVSERDGGRGICDAAIAFADGVKNDEQRAVAVAALLLALGIPDAEFDHDPALGLRGLNDAGDDYEPPQLDPLHIVPRGYVDHRTKTSGTPPGQKVVHVANGDVHKIAKADRLEKARRAMEVDNAAALRSYSTDPLAPVMTSPGVPRSAWPKGRGIQSRPFRKGRKPKNG